MHIKDSYEEIFEDVNSVLVVLAHPDDAEVTCGGLISRLTKDGKKVRLVVTTNGEKGMRDRDDISPEDFSKRRIQEQTDAGKILGISEEDNFNLEIPDGEVECTVENI